MTLPTYKRVLNTDGTFNRWEEVMTTNKWYEGFDKLMKDIEDQCFIEDKKPETYSGIRAFSSGATRDSEEGKLDYEGFLSPLVIKRYAEYLHSHRKQADGKLRDSDNWQKGIPLNVYMKSGWRHFFDWWYWHRKPSKKNSYLFYSDLIQDQLEDALCALLFNTSGYLHELLKRKEP